MTCVSMRAPLAHRHADACAAAAFERRSGTAVGAPTVANSCRICRSFDFAAPWHDVVIFVAPQGEYGLTNVLMSHGYNVATLMARYSPVRRCPNLPVESQDAAHSHWTAKQSGGARH